MFIRISYSVYEIQRFQEMKKENVQVIVMYDMLHAFCPNILRYHYIVLLCCTIMFISVGVPKYYRYTLYIFVFTF